MSIRPMESTDIPAAVEIEARCFCAPWSAEAFASSMASGHNRFFLAIEDSAPVGYIGMQLLPPEGDILNLAVLPEYRRRGLGRSRLIQRRDTAKHPGRGDYFHIRFCR